MSEISSISQSQNSVFSTKFDTQNSNAAINSFAKEDKTKIATVSSEDMAKAAVSTVNTQSDSEIISEIKRNGLAATKSVQQIAQDYHISVARAQSILDKIKNNGSMVKTDETQAQEHTVEPEMSNSYSYSVEDTSNSETSTVEYSV